MARASGKVILFGEHAVVYGVPAIAAGIDQGAQATAKPAPEPALRIGDLEVKNDDGTELAAAYAALLESLGSPALATRVQSELPPGCGLGASAAIGVAVARAVLDATTNRDEDPEEAPADLRRVLSAANAWERVFHGNPSGIDAAAAALGTTILYDRQDGAQRLHLRHPFTLAVAIAGPPAATREMVANVATLKARRPTIVDKALDGIHSIVRNATLCLRDGDFPSLGKLMNLNHMLLSGLFLSTEEIERACTAARSAGALGAKLTGSGGGGAVIALVEDPEPVLHAWQACGFECFATKVRPSHHDCQGPRP
jgi:mevalonate kinase